MHVKTFGDTVRGFFKLRRGRAGHKVLRKRIEESATIDGIHVCQLIAAMTIASIGLNVDSTEAVIGAMLICPLMGSVLSIGYGVATLDRKFAQTAMVGLLVQMLVCLATSTVYFVLSPLSNATSELLTNSNPTVWDVLIAFVGGFAGALGISRKQEPTTLIAGVAVATALMPPLCATGYGLAMRDLALALSALYEFLINVVFIAFGSELVFVALRVPLKTDLDGDGIVTAEEEQEAQHSSVRFRRVIVVCSILFAVPCLFFSHRLVVVTMEQNGTVFEVQDTYNTEQTTKELEVLCDNLVSYSVGAQESFDTEKNQISSKVVASIMTSSSLSSKQQEKLTEIVKLNVENVDDVVFGVES